MSQKVIIQGDDLFIALDVSKIAIKKTTLRTMEGDHLEYRILAPVSAVDGTIDPRLMKDFVYIKLVSGEEKCTIGMVEDKTLSISKFRRDPRLYSQLKFVRVLEKKYNSIKLK